MGVNLNREEFLSPMGILLLVGIAAIYVPWPIYVLVNGVNTWLLDFLQVLSDTMLIMAVLECAILYVRSENRAIFALNVAGVFAGLVILLVPLHLFSYYHGRIFFPVF